jgi:hypothetical protein
MKKLFFCIGLLMHFMIGCTQADSINSKQKDSIYISGIENQKLKPKVLHAEPLYIDLIRDLGARKGEKEWNLGLGMTDNLQYDEVEVLVEYEFAPINRLGFEVELPFTFFSPQKGISKDSIPSSRLNGLKLATQWTFSVSEKSKTSLAFGYIHQFNMVPFRKMGRSFSEGHTFNPFLVGAKRWGNNFHTLIYTGPIIEKGVNRSSFTYDVNSNFHYMIPGTRNFLGMEFNKNFHAGDFDMVIRPQMRLGVAENLLIGIVGAVPVKRENHRFGMFTRLIWEPAAKKHG